MGWTATSKNTDNSLLWFGTTEMGCECFKKCLKCLAKFVILSSAVMKLNDKVLTVNTTVQVVHGMELSKDQTGVTAKISNSNHTVSVHFDGYTAVIQLTGKVPIWKQSLRASKMYSKTQNSNANRKAGIKLYVVWYLSALPPLCFTSTLGAFSKSPQLEHQIPLFILY